MTDLTLLGIAGSVSAESRTRAAVEVALEAAERADIDSGDAGAGDDPDGGSVETALLHLAEYDLDAADGRTLDEYEGDTAEALERIVAADAYVVGTPVYRASYSGALKNLLDMVPRGEWQGDAAPLSDSAVGLVATGATDDHYLAIDEQLRPLMGFFGAHAVGGSVYVDADQFEDEEVADGDIRDRLETLGPATVEQALAVERSSHLSELGPQV